MNTQATDRQNDGIAALARSIFPSFDYQARYGATVAHQRGPNSIDVIPDDKRIPGMGGIEIDPGIPGATLTVPQGTRCMVGWKGGDPTLPFVDVWAQGGTPTEIDFAAGTFKINAAQVALGSGASHPLLFGDTFLTALATFLTATASATTAAQIATAASAFSTALIPAPLSAVTTTA